MSTENMHEDQLSSQLQQMRRENPYAAPEGYFETFSDNLTKKIAAEKSNSTTTSIEKTNSIWERLQVLLQPKWAVAILLVFAISYFGIQHFVNNQTVKYDDFVLEETLLEIDDETIENYIFNNISVFDDTELAANPAELEEATIFDFEEEIDDALIEEYILTNIDNQNLLEDLL